MWAGGWCWKLKYFRRHPLIVGRRWEQGWALAKGERRDRWPHQVLWGEWLWSRSALDGREQGERCGAIFLLWEKLEQEGPDAFSGKALPSTHTRIRWNGVLKVILEDCEGTVLLREGRG
jgi:hypothetical protein